MTVATTRAEPRHWMLLLAPVIVLNLALQPRGHWMLGANVVKHALSARGADAPLYETFAPERQLAAIMRDIHDSCYATAEEFGAPGDYVIGANIAGFISVAEPMRAFGVV